MQTAGPTTRRGEQLGPILRGDLRGAAEAWCILQAFDALRQIALEPRRTVASLSRTMAAIWGTLSRCSTARRTICARVRSRGALVVRYR